MSCQRIYRSFISLLTSSKIGDYQNARSYATHLRSVSELTGQGDQPGIRNALQLLEDEADASECGVSEVELGDDEGWGALILEDDDYMSETDVQSGNDD